MLCSTLCLQIIFISLVWLKNSPEDRFNICFRNLHNFVFRFLLDEMMTRYGDFEGSFADEDDPNRRGNIKLRRRPSTSQGKQNKCSC